MKLCIIGDSHAPRIFRQAWQQFAEVYITPNPEDADITFIAQDTPTDEHGMRDERPIRALVQGHFPQAKGPVVLTSQVEPGFTRSLGLPIINMAETLRIKDAYERALRPDYFVIGMERLDQGIPAPLVGFFMLFGNVPIVRVTWEECEYAKIAVNLMLAAQVDATNQLAAKCPGEWRRVADVLRHDKRIGPHAYLTPGRWQDSPHLLRDWVTFQKL